MDFVNKIASAVGDKADTTKASSSSAAEPAKEGGVGGLMDLVGGKLNSAAGGGKASEKDEDLLDKGVDFVQEKFLKEGKQDNETAAEQFKDEQISDMIRKQYKSATGKEFPIADKETKTDL